MALLFSLLNLFHCDRQQVILSKSNVTAESDNGSLQTMERILVAASMVEFEIG